MVMSNNSLKICVLGQVGSGKSSLSLQFTQSHFPTNFDHTVEDVYEKDVEIDGEVYKLHILDTANQDDYSDLKDLQLKEADGFIIVYNVASLESFAGVSDAYRHIMRTRDSLPRTILVANQTDLTNMRQVSSSQGESIATEFEFDQYFEVSSKNNINVTECFTALIKAIISSRQETLSVTDANRPSRLNNASPSFSESSFQRKAFTIGTSFDNASIMDDKDVATSKPHSVIPSRPVDLRTLEARQKKQDEKKESVKRKSSNDSLAGSSSSGRRTTKKAEKEESKGGCCIVM